MLFSLFLQGSVGCVSDLLLSETETDPLSCTFLMHENIVSIPVVLIQGGWAMVTNDPPHGKTNNLHRRKHRRRSASQ